ncbi:S8 family serine peptidase [Candidatus Viridilinea mediisalina]|uniref:Uncharacterized protein n=1 Tax=Candidatus Viridilinea mediisalina TaxID=2024553 RepID=A0A2A6RK91_9CHLR|nr:S8 family serine peptidase [Candidatus Viridilinea mediisalina]PDW03288.1 hypothetical protein CJ255_09585 [Candidatus Viridilinea mediisalina]
MDTPVQFGGIQRILMPQTYFLFSRFCILVLKPGFSLLALLLLCLLVAGARAPVQAEQQGRYMVRLAHEPIPPLAASLEAIQQALGQPVTPVFTYRHALYGFAFDLTPHQAEALRSLPFVAAVQPEGYATLQADTSPWRLAVTDAALRPALLHAHLSSAESEASGRALAHYDATTRKLYLQLFYHGLAEAPITPITLEHTALSRTLTPIGTPCSAICNLQSTIGNGINAELRDRYGAQRIALGPLSAGVYVDSIAIPPAAEALLLAGGLELHLSSDQVLLHAPLTPSRGEGVLLGVIDSGIDPNNPAFQNPAPDGYVYQNPHATGGFLGVCDPNNPRYDPTFPCNNKLIGAYTFDATATTPDPQGRPSPRDNHGHGTHIAGLAVGNYIPRVRIGLAEVGPIAGVAPRANLIVYDVCGLPENDLVCPHSALLAAIDQAIADGVQVINYSIGAGASDPWDHLESLGLLRAFEHDIFVAAAAGNRGHADDSISAPANAPWVTAVTASSHGRRFVQQLHEFDGGTAALRPTTLLGAGLGPQLGPVPIRSAAALDNPTCAPFSAEQQAAIEGAIVVCAPGALERIAQVQHVRAGGGVGVVFVNHATVEEQFEEAVRYPLPAIALTHSDALLLEAWLGTCDDCSATLSATYAEHDATLANRILPYSSRGPNSRVPTVLKPNLTAPGAVTLGPFGDFTARQPDYAFMQGSSMAVAQISGLAAILRHIHPTWSAAEIASALMLTALPANLADGEAASPFDQGAGRAHGVRAAFAGFVLPETAAAFRQADPAHGGDPSQLNLAAITSEHCERSCSFTRTLRSTFDVPLTYTITLHHGDGFSLHTTPANSISLAPGASVRITVTATVNGRATGSYSYGAVSFSNTENLAAPAQIPVALQTFGVNLPPTLELETAALSGSQRISLHAEALDGLEATSYGLQRMLSEALQLEPGATYERELRLPPDSLLLRVELEAEAAGSHELSLYATSQPGQPSSTNTTLLCRTRGANACELTATELSPKIRIRVAQTAEAELGPSSSRLRYGLVRSTPPNPSNLSVSSPITTSAGVPFDLTVTWQLPPSPKDERYLGLLTLHEHSSARDLGSASIILDLHGTGEPEPSPSPTPTPEPEAPWRVYLPLVGMGSG